MTESYQLNCHCRDDSWDAVALPSMPSHAQPSALLMRPPDNDELREIDIPG